MYGSVDCSFNNEVTWHSPALGVAPIMDTFYIWHGSTPQLLELYANCYNALNTEERDRAARYYRQADTQRYVIQHGLLRLLLGWYMGCGSYKGMFRKNENEKPYLSGEPEKPCFFNLSNSKGDFLIAIGPKEIGVDIELVNTAFDHRDIASNYFSKEELNYIESQTDATETFFLLWTRKEALLKACGTGIDDNLPLMPSLDGLRSLPAGYAQLAWLTESFKLKNKIMVSVTMASPQIAVQMLEMNERWISQLFSNMGAGS